VNLGQEEGSKTVFPGEEVAISEEYIPGEGTYEAGGRIYAALVGELELDRSDMVARVRGYNPPLELKPVDIVIGNVEEVKSSMVIVNVAAVEGKDRAITGETEGTIHISKVSEGYTRDIGREFHSSDIIRARVLQVKPSLQLATNARDLGVVKSHCSRCRSPLEVKGRELYCNHCERSEPRKISTEYDNVLVRAP
jgi:exosome complex component CSL4